MDKNAIKKYAIWARTELIARVSQRAEKYDITAEADADASSVNGILLSDAEKKQRKALIEQVKQKGFDQVMEEVAYTWFNRFIALRFMEVNGYLPSHIRVFTDENNSFRPQILAEAIHLELDGLDMEKVYEMKNNNKNEELYKYLIISQCNDLSKILPGMFQEISDYTELLFPENILRDGSVIEQMVSQIEEKNWDISEGGQVEILGWMYQFYISEKHESVIDPIHGKFLPKEEVPAATALYTTDWVVRYLVDNSVGRYWIERNPDSNLKDELEYYVKPKNGIISKVDNSITPKEVTVLDPSMGSAHFSVYAFDVLMKIYLEYGVSERDAAASIVKYNLFGLDIDDRSAQIAYFAIMMKARQYDRRFFTRDIQPNFYAIQESNDIDNYIIEYFSNGDNKQRAEIVKVITLFKDAKEYGSIIEMEPIDFDLLYKRLEEIKVDINIYKDVVISKLMPLVKVAQVMSNKYAIVATNPPYFNRFDDKLKKYTQTHYKDYSGDLFSIFIYHNFDYCKKDGYLGFMTPFVWMFIKTYESLRQYVEQNKHIVSLIQFEYSAFEEATVPICAFVLKNEKSYEKGYYFRLSDFTGGMEVQKEKVLEAQRNKSCGFYFESMQDAFLKIPGKPIAYWASDDIVNAFQIGDMLEDYADCCTGMQTGNNDRYVRYWFEVNMNDFDKAAVSTGKKWIKYNCGGDSRKWYGNHWRVINWENEGAEVKKEKGSVIRNEAFFFKEGISWKRIGSSDFYLRYLPQGFIFDQAGDSMFPKDEDNLYYILGFVNTPVALSMFKFIAPTLNLTAGNMNKLPIILNLDKKERISELVKANIIEAKRDWDSFETSWDFEKHPLIRNEKTIEKAFEAWEDECEKRFHHVKENEEKINELFIDIYHLNGQINPLESDSEVTIRRPDKRREVISFISYAVGCMFGRYSLDISGVVYAGGEWDNSKYLSFPADKDGIIPISDEEYFDDDIVERFISFVQIVYGDECLEENLSFIAEAIGGKGSPREIIRSYFLNDFYADHIKTYQKKPIYWLFSSGKKQGFKCLLYMHRYRTDSIARIRTDYVHELQARYRTAIEELSNKELVAVGSEKIRTSKKLKKIKEQEAELHKYEEKIHHLADQMIQINIDDGVKTNYEILKEVLANL
ncbi:BREX-1 system adenine-specific DNA-methyltransferase PglX [Butyrivibrio sp. WCD3002]|uniref:BREX-1 system adenine-specific DNA-methyltransferase PglX n=1 Tax=Butyrivibrio sp. WCD3002 TaxID=1280676 RepID=UPI00041C0F7A|nr:BREX-1 system adenine-specific DNA-methyltransferase PglX [Butyrivibrio sp. WCD3002]